MSLKLGTHLGPYEILAPLGSGGMGDVYRARDTKLKRDLALKVLPEAFASDLGRMARFQREAEVLASLNHPNIAHIYGVEERALALELVEGETLPCPLPLETAVAYAKQIAEALEYAHERGVIHRDLKPANIKVTADGVVKLLDFGLAKAIENPTHRTEDPANSPTLTADVGVILGTAAYMSPEQASGKTADRRSDIWSFGAVLYEMLAGKRAFEGDSASDALASVLKLNPDWSALPKSTPTSIRRLVQRCLTKDRKQRLQAIGEARIVLENPQPDEPATAPVTGRLVSRLGWVSAALLAIAFVALAFIHFRERPAVERTERYTIALPENGTVHSFAISPDARYVVIAAMVNGKQQLWLRPLDALQAQPMPTTEDATFPFWSPDSRYIGFFAQGRLKKIAAGGGPAQSICDATGARGGAWNRQDVILFYHAGNSGEGIQRVAAGGGAPFDVFKTQGNFRYPVFLPDGRHFLYTDTRTSETGGIYVSSLDGVENRRLLSDRSAAVFVPSSPGNHAGYLLLVRENNLMALRFDSATVQTSGEVLPVAEGVSISLANVGYAPVTVSENGVLLYWTGNAAGGTNQLLWYDRTGKVLGPAGAPGIILGPRISPDERVVAFTANRGSTWDIWLRDLARAADTRFTAGGGVNLGVSWSPKGDSIAFTSVGTGAFGTLYQKATSGSGPAERLVPTTTSSDRSEQWSRDGRFITYTRINSKTNLDVWVLPLGEATSTNRKPLAFLQTEFNETQGQLSPDSHWMAYTSDESGEREVYVRPFPPGDGKWRISTAGGEQPRWRGDGKELFYAAADGKMTAVAVKAELGSKPTFEPGVPIPLFDAHMVAPGGTVNDVFQYDVTADGKRFLVVTSAARAASSPPLTVWVNWIAGLKK